MKLTFCGGAGEVTGANYLLEADGKRILIDCGMAQGSKFAEHQNFEPFPYDPASIEALFVTHAHIDHTGRIPRLWRDGFRGKIYSTPPTRDASEYLLLDSENVLHKEASRDGHLPLYENKDVLGAMSLWHNLKYHETTGVGDVRVTPYNAGHILGSACYRVEAEGKSVVFSGDLGNFPAPIIQDTEMLASADYVLIESAYGNRVHEPAVRREMELESAIDAVAKRKGVLLIPAFAMERTQDLLFHINDLMEAKKIPHVPVYIDSPLAIKLTAVYKKFEDYFDKEIDRLIKSGDDIFNFPGLHLTLTTEQSKEINHAPNPKIILAGSGMSNGGRILHHEARYLSDPQNMILFVGFQARGTLGRRILDGAQMVKINGEEVPVRCEKRNISAYSAHADQPRLLEWLGHMASSVKQVFVVQGEEEAAAALAAKIKSGLKLKVSVPRNGESVML
ncbi:MAG: MBL fold metallo-hydrolase [Candidatus Liptonbacteria bacterium]